MLVDQVEMLETARTNGYGVATPTVWDEPSIKVCLDVAEKLDSPIILGHVRGYGSSEPFESRRAFQLADLADVPVSVQQDHGLTFEENVWGIRAGFPAMMVDRSELPYEENVAKTREIVEIAHAADVYVEAEVGHVGHGSGDDNEMTSPEQAEQFVSETGVDMLAVAVGNLHGVYEDEPNIDYDRIEAMRDGVSVPLVVHGGSGLGYDTMSKMAGSGLTKFNMQTYLSRAALNAMQEYLDAVEIDATVGDVAEYVGGAVPVDGWKNTYNETKPARRPQLKSATEAAYAGWAEELARYIIALGSDGNT